MSKAKNSLGVAIFIETLVSGTFIKVGEMTDIPGILGDKTGKIDVTNLDSSGYTEVISNGLKEAPEFSLKCNYVADDAGQVRIFELGQSNINTKIKLEFNDQITPLTGNKTVIIRNGYVTSIPNITPGKGAQLMMDFSFQSSGEPDVTLAS